MRYSLLFVCLLLAGCHPSARPLCEQVHTSLRLASDAAEAGDYDAFRAAYEDALPLVTPVKNALYDVSRPEDLSYPLMASGDAWQTYQSVIGLLSVRTVNDTAGVELFSGFIREKNRALDSTLTATVTECSAL